TVKNQAIVVESGSTTNGSTNPGQIELVSLAAPGTTTLTALQPVQITELVVPSPNPGLGNIGGIPNAFAPQATLTAAAGSPPLAGVRIFGRGFLSGSPQVRLDSVDITAPPAVGGAVNVVSDREVDVTIPSSFLLVPHRYALDVVVAGCAPSNATDFNVIKTVPMSPCTAAPASPRSGAFADQIKNNPLFSPIAVVPNNGCNSISIIDINPADVTPPPGG